MNRVTIAFVVGLSLQVGCTKKTTVGQKSESTASVIQGYREGEASSLDPMQQGDLESSLLVNELYSTLVAYDYLKRPRELIPDLLESMPQRTVSSKITYAFKLRQGVRFIDDPCFPEGKGRELTSADVIYSFKRFADARINSITFSMLDGVIDGLNSFRSETQAKSVPSYSSMNISGVRETGRHSFELDFIRESPLNMHAITALFIVPQEAVDRYGSEFSKHPVGSGPFKLAEYTRRGVVRLIKNDRYYRSYPQQGNPTDRGTEYLRPAGRALPLAAEVRLQLIEEPQPRFLKFLSGEIDFFRVDGDSYGRLLERSKNGAFVFKDKANENKFNIVSEMSEALYFMQFSMKDGVVGKSPALRKAIAKAIDPKGFVEIFMRDRGVPGESIISPALAGNATDSGSRWHEYSLTEARKLLKEAGYDGGKGLPDIQIEFSSTDARTRRIFEFVRSELAKIGISAKGNFQSYSTLAKKVENGNFQILYGGWMPYYPDAENVYALFYGKNLPPQANSSFFQNERYDALYEKSRHMRNSTERYKIFQDMNQILSDEAPFFLPIFRYDLYLTKKNLLNFRGLSYEYLEKN